MRRRVLQGQDWEDGFADGLMHSLCFFPLLSYGSTAPLAEICEERLQQATASGWEERPVGRARLRGRHTDPEDNVLKEFLIAVSLLEQRAAKTRAARRDADALAGRDDAEAGQEIREEKTGQLQVQGIGTPWWI